MDQLIGGISTAFLTSIAGVVASMAFNLSSSHTVHKCQRSIDRFCEVFSLYAMPKPVTEETAMLTLQQEQTAYVRQAVEDLSNKLAVQIEGSIMRAMLPVQRSMDNFILAATQAQRDLAGDNRADPALQRFAQHERLRVEPAALIHQTAELTTIIMI